MAMSIRRFMQFAVGVFEVKCGMSKRVILFFSHASVASEQILWGSRRNFGLHF